MSATEIKFLAFRVYRFADAKAFQKLHALHVIRIRRYIAFRVAKSEDADELTNEVFLRGWEYMTAQRVESVPALLFRIARNLIADHYRKSGQVIPLTAVIENAAMAPGSLAEDVQVREEFAELIEVMQRLKPEYREVLEMRYQHEMSIEEISDVLGKTPNAVRVLVHRAKQALKDQV